MKPVFLDTCILIDFTRGKPEAVVFIKGLTKRPFISSLVVAELFAGIRNTYENKMITALIDSCLVVDLNRSIAEAGGQFKCKFGPSHGVGLIDALLAASVQTSDAVLATLNLKHFPMLQEQEKHKPY